MGEESLAKHVVIADKYGKKIYKTLARGLNPAAECKKVLCADSACFFCI